MLSKVLCQDSSMEVHSPALLQCFFHYGKRLYFPAGNNMFGPKEVIVSTVCIGVYLFAIA